MSLSLLVHPPDETSENDVDRNLPQCYIATLSTTILTWTDMEANPGLRGGTSRLRLGTAIRQELLPAGTASQFV